MAGKQHVHQLIVLNLHTYNDRDNRLNMPSKQGCVWRTQHIVMTHTGTGLNAVLHVAMGKMIMQISMCS